MEYGKVIVKKERTGYLVSVGCNDITLSREYFRKDYAYSDAKFIRSMIKRGHHPARAVQNLGYTQQARE